MKQSSSSDGIDFIIMELFLTSCSADNKEWSDVKSAWRTQCDDHGEEFEAYAQASMSVLDDLAVSPSKNAKVYVLSRQNETEDGNREPLAVFQANSTFLPGFTGRVLRIRHIVLSPKYDYGVFSEDDYKEILAETFAQATALSSKEMESDHVKFHFRTPADLYFFREMRPSLEREPEFKDVKAYGAWISFSLTHAFARA